MLISWGKGLVNIYWGVGTGALLIFSVKKVYSLYSILRENTQNKQKLLYPIINEVGKNSSSVIILSKKSMCPITFCTGPNPSMNIDLSLSTTV